MPIIYAQYLYWYWYLKVRYWYWYWYLDHWYWYWYWYLFVEYLIQDCLISITMLNGCTGRCVRLSRPLVGFRMHFKSLHFRSFHSVN